MGWVKIDDDFPWHRKVDDLPDKAFRLHITALCWCSKNLTDGFIPRTKLARISHTSNTSRELQRLVDHGLWEPVEGGFVIHDYLDYNPPAERLKVERKRNAARQQDFRDRKAARRNAVTDDERNAVTRKATGGARNAVSNSAPSRPVPSPQTETPSEFPVDRPPARRNTVTAMTARAPQFPPNCQPLIDALTDAGYPVGWPLSEAEWFVLEATIKRCGVPAMVRIAVALGESAKNRVFSARFFMSHWRELPTIAPERQNLPAANSQPKSRRQQETDAWFEQGMARARDADLNGTPSVFDLPYPDDSPFPEREIEQ